MIYGTAFHGKDTERLTQIALKAGMTAFDSATNTVYAEELVGYAFAKHGIDRANTWIQTKFTPDSNEPKYSIKAPLYEQVKQSFYWSLSAMNINYLDGYIMHGPLGGVNLDAQDFEIWRSMEELY